MSVTVDCGEGKHDLCIGSGTSHYLIPQLNDGERFDCACPCHRADARPNVLARVRAAMSKYDGDACRPEFGIEPEEIARIALAAHLDIAACYCPTCVLARVIRDLDVPATQEGQPGLAGDASV